jgi:hypothetical protein
MSHGRRILTLMRKPRPKRSCSRSAALVRRKDCWAAPCLAGNAQFFDHDHATTGQPANCFCNATVKIEVISFTWFE